MWAIGGGSGIGVGVGVGAGVGVGVGVGVDVVVCKNGLRSVFHEETNFLYSPGHHFALSVGSKPISTKAPFNEGLLP